MTTAAPFVVAVAAHDDMECCDYTVSIEASFNTRMDAEAAAHRLNDSEGHTWHFWVLTAAEAQGI